jgi:hypothetical protein
MIMSEKMLEKLAESIVTRFFNEKVALNDGVTETAQSQNLNEEQIKRLVETVNTAAFLKKFNNMADPKTMNQDRVVEFETADPNAVISRMLNSAKTEMDSTGAGTPLKSDLQQDLPITRADEAPPVFKKEEPTKLSEARISKPVVIKRLRKTAEFLKEQEWQARNNYTDATQTLLTRFRQHDDLFSAFEKDAFYHLGPPAAPHLQLLRQALRKPTADYDYTDMQKYARVVDMSTVEMRLFLDMLKTSQTIADCKTGQKKVGEHLGRIA